METVFHISNCPEKSQVKYATCTLLNSALTWNEIQKIETELWNLIVENNDLAAYTQRFQELTMMCTKMVPEEEDRIEKLFEENVNAGQTGEENMSTQQYIVFPLWSSISSNYKSSDDKAEDDTIDDDAYKEATKQSDVVRKEFEAQCDTQLLQEKITRASSTNSFNTVSTPVNTASASRTFTLIGPSSGQSFVPFGGFFLIDVANLPHDPLMPELEDTAKI
ncbi:hypothetical protein Tco_1381497 [Tanacetum coccineum]